jgi:hypothetical protein
MANGALMLPEGAFWEKAMRKLALIALSVAGLGLALTACASRYYDDRYGYYDRPYGHVEYTDRGRYNDPYYNSDSDQSRYRDYRDRY